MIGLEQLIEELCPDGVGYVKIGDVVKYQHSGKYIVKTEKYDSKYKTPVLTAGQSFILGYTDETDGIYYASEDNPVIIFDDFTGAFKWVDFPFKVKSSAMKMLSADSGKTILRYIFHVMGKINFFSDEHKRLWIGKYSSFKIPLPHLRLQREIVRILDSFTGMADLLNDELAARRRQYAFYREKLLEEAGSKAKWMTIEAVCKKISSGGTPNTGHAEYYEGEIPWLRTQEVDWGEITDTEIKITQEGLKKSSANWIAENCVIVAMYGATAAKVAVNKIPLTTNQACCNLQIDETKAMYRYVYHWLCYKYNELKNMGRGSQSNINARIIREFPIPVPPLLDQAEIVSFLDCFDVLCNDRIKGIPAEIEARNKQYRYYRDRLLDFDEINKKLRDFSCR